MIARQGTAFITVFDGENFNVVTDSSGHIMTRSQWNELKKVMDSFYEQHSDLDIKRHNKGAVERRMEEVRNRSIANTSEKRQKRR